MGCAPTDSLRLVSIYISFFSLSNPGFGKKLNITGWSAVVLMWTGLAIFFSDRQIRHTESLVTVGFQAVGLHHIIASNVQHSCLVVVTLASSVSLLSCLDNLFCSHIPPSDYFLCSVNTQQSGRTVVMFFMVTHEMLFCLCSIKYSHGKNY